MLRVEGFQKYIEVLYERGKSTAASAASMVLLKLTKWVRGRMFIPGGNMETEFAYYERRITEETIRALMAECDQARDVHLRLLKLYRERLEAERALATAEYRRLRDVADSADVAAPPAKRTRLSIRL